MQAMMVKEQGTLSLTDCPTPSPQPDELLVRVIATAVNRTDLVNRERNLGYLTSPILGVEVAGVVEQTDQANTYPVGTRVMGLVNGGGYAEYVTLPAARAMVIPAHLSFEEAAAIPEVFLTAYQTLFWLGHLRPHQSVLVHAGGSGVGTAAIQLATVLGQAKVITTAGTAKKRALARELGATLTIDYHQEDFAAATLVATAHQGVDVLLDFVGASYWHQNLQSLKVDGHWVLIGVLGGTTVSQVDLLELMVKRAHLVATLLTPRTDAYKAKLSQEFAREALPLFTTKQLRPIVDRTFALAELEAAHTYMAQNQNLGKIIIRVAD